MCVNYYLTENSIIIDNNQFISYGIECCTNNTVMYSYPDISLNRTDVSDLCELLNKMNISPVHFRDMIEDLLAK